MTAPGTAIAVACSMIALYGIDRSLARLETNEVESEAQGLYAAGQKLLNTGRPGEAVDAFQRAHSLDRTNRDFELSLAAAQLAAGKAGDAERALSDALNRDSNDGRANLLMARVLKAEGRFDDAVSYYHRAIYGAWPSQAGRERTDARLELADQLAKRGRDQELLSEVLLLDNDAQGDPILARKVAELYLQAGSAGRAAAAYHALIRANPRDADAYVGLGEAELERGDYHAAHSAFAAALRDRPEDPKAAARVRLADQLAELDPTSRRLSSREKFRRSQQILSLTEDATVNCLRGQTSNELHDLLAAAAKLRAERAPATPTNEAAEARLELAGRIWKSRLRSCSAPPAPADSLTIIHKKIEQ
jgi:tetratricopeptide (TPR) repeat protein